MTTNWTRALRNRKKEAILEMDWPYTEDRRWKHRQSCVRVESKGKRKRGAPTQSWRTRMTDDENITWTECKKTGGKEKDEVANSSEKPMFHIGIKRTKSKVTMRGVQVNESESMLRNNIQRAAPWILRQCGGEDKVTETLNILHNSGCI